MDQKNTTLPENYENEPVVPGSPLLSLDIIMEGYHRTMRLIDDANMLDMLARKRKWRHKWNFASRLLKEGRTIIVTSPDVIIEFASENVYYMNGYFPNEVLGKSPRIFQGDATEAEARQHIRKAVSAKKSFVTELNNYKKNGELYRCQIEGHPLFNVNGTLVNFIAFEIAA